MKINFKHELTLIISSGFDFDYQTIYSLIEVPLHSKFGDLSFPCFTLAKKTQKQPQIIAKEIQEKIGINQYFEKIEVIGGYLNVFINKKLYFKNVLENFSLNFKHSQQKQRVIVEYMNANPNKPLHLGQARNICLGDSLIRILRFLGYQVDAVNYGDDSGVNVAMNLVAHLFYQVPWQKKGVKFDHYCGEVYRYSLLQSEKDSQFEEKLNLVLREIENRDSQIAQKQKEYVRQCLLAQMETCWQMNAYFNLNTWETDILHLELLQETLELIKKLAQVKSIKQGKYQGCLVFDLTGIEKFEGLKEKMCVLVKSNGTTTYLVKDIAYALWKLGYLKKHFYYTLLTDKQTNNEILWSTNTENKSEDNIPLFGNYDVSIAVIDKRQSFFQEIIGLVLNQLSQTKIIDQQIAQKQKRYFHLSYGVVYLSPETLLNCGHSLTTEEKNQSYLPFSSRKGWTVTIDEILVKLKETAEQETKKRNVSQSDQWIKEVSQKISVSALRFWLSKVDKNKDVVFDINQSLSLEGDTGVYVQYSYARIINILKKIEKQETKTIVNYELLIEEVEFELIKKIDLFEDIIKKVEQEMSLHFLTNYLIELCRVFNRFYDQCSVTQAKPELKQARIVLVKTTSIILKLGLNLLGIDTLERM